MCSEMETSILDSQHIFRYPGPTHMFIAACFQCSEYNLSYTSPAILVQSSHCSFVMVKVGRIQQEQLLIEDIAGLL